MIDSQSLHECIEYYRKQGAPGDQQMLVALLREVQQEAGGVLEQAALGEIAGAYGIKPALLQALIRRIPDLRCAEAPHSLEICGTCRAGAALRAYVEKTYGVQSGSVCAAAGFTYRVVPCMKNCRKGPSIRWDGQLYSQAETELIRRLIGK